MKKFDLEKALAGEPVVTRDGVDVSDIHYFNSSKTNRSVACVIGGVVLLFHKDGCYLYESVECGNDLFMKEETITVNGFEVPAPETNIVSDGHKRFVADPASKKFYFGVNCNCDEYSISKLRRGILHKSPENAIAHAKAMLCINPNGDCDE